MGAASCRACRFYSPEQQLLRHTIRLRNLPGSETAYAGGVLRNLAVACSHPDAILGVGSSGLTGGPERDEVRRAAGGGGLSP